MRAICRRRIWIGLVACPLLVLLVNWRLHRMLSDRDDYEPTTLAPTINLFIRDLAEKLTPNPQYRNVSALWIKAAKWPCDKYVFPMDESVGNVLHALHTAPILQADYAKKGTQLKVVLTLEGGERVFFKPQWYSRNEVIRGHVYSGKDRHNAEVVAFFLSAILDIRWAPPAIIRRVDIKRDIFDKATGELQDTMFYREDGNLCLYGKCFYCRRNETVCGDERNELEGSVIYLIDRKFNKYRSPWQRTYDEKTQADWETNMDYCVKVKKSLNTPRLLDLIDVAIFDYLLQNGDRHHYETAMSRILYVDNGKGLGNPHKDFNDILAPLYQCCMLRHSTWKRLKMLSGGYLSTSLSALLLRLPGAPLMTDLHLRAMDRRLLTVYSTVDTCIKKFGRNIFKEK